MIARISFILVVAFTTLLSLQAFCQESVDYSDRAEEYFQDGLKQFTAGAFREALTAFDRIIAEYPACQRITAAWVMKGKALCRLDENLEAARTLKAFLAKYPSSEYKSDAGVMLGGVYARIGRYQEALQAYTGAWQSPPIPDRLWEEIIAALDSIIDKTVSVTSLERMITETRYGPGRAYLWLKIAEKESARENIVAARTALDTLSFRYGEDRFRERVARVRNRLTLRSAVKLGVLLPLMRNAEPSAIKEVGNDVYDGVRFALEEYERDPLAAVKVSYEVRDTERDPKTAAKGVDELADISDLVGIVGPVFSQSTGGAAGEATSRSIPLITPTANANGIAGTGPYVFQANPDYETRGKAMAKFAVEVKGFKTLAVLAPSDSYAKYMAEGFVAEATKLGAQVLMTSWYLRGSADLKPQLADLRRAAMKESSAPSISFAGKMNTSDLMRFAELGVPVKRIDSLMHAASSVPVEWLIGTRTKRELDSLGITTVFDESRVDSLQYPVTGIQGLYLPLSSPEEIAVVSSQIAYFNLQTQMLGSGEWNDFLELNANRRYCKGVLFESDTFTDSNSVSYTDFQVGFAMRFKKHPSRNALYGYDTARLMLSLVRSGASTRESLKRALADVTGYQGLHSKIGFSKGRVNGWISVLLFDGDAIQKVDDVYVGDELNAGQPAGKP